MAQIQKEKLLALKNVKWVIGNQEKIKLVDHVVNPSSKPLAHTPKIDRKPFIVPSKGIDPHHVRANLKIQDGCDFYCSFCIIPFARGPARSRVFEDILLEANKLADNGHQEVVLTGVNIGTYDHNGRNFIDIIKALEKIKGLKRIRISSIEPTTIPFELFDLMAESNKLCPYLHLPLQSGSDPILDAMSRKYSVKEYEHFLQKVLNRVPSIGLGTDVIVGFPGETDTLFDQTYSLLSRLPFSYFHVFSYSERSLARSKKLPSKVPDSVIHQRSKSLRALSKEKRMVFHDNKVGSIDTVLFEQFKHDCWWGHTSDFAKVAVQSNNDLTNQIKPVKLIAQGPEHIQGHLL